MNRREFIRRTAAASSAVLVSTVLAGCVRTPPEERIAALLVQKLPTLNLDPAGTRAFAEALVERFRRFGLSGSGLDDVVHALAKGESPDVALPFQTWNGSIDGFRSLDEHIVEQFLLSSDFFLHDADMGRMVQYVGWHNPRAGGCQNRFANLGFDT